MALNNSNMLNDQNKTRAQGNKLKASVGAGAELDVSDATVRARYDMKGRIKWNEFKVKK